MDYLCYNQKGSYNTAGPLENIEKRRSRSSTIGSRDQILAGPFEDDPEFRLLELDTNEYSAERPNSLRQHIDE